MTSREISRPRRACEGRRRAGGGGPAATRVRGGGDARVMAAEDGSDGDPSQRRPSRRHPLGSGSGVQVVNSGGAGATIPSGGRLLSVTMIGRGSPKLFLSKGAQKKSSPKPKRPGGSPKEKVRAAWNPTLEKTLVDLLHEHKTPDYRGQNGWPSKTWNKIVTEFHLREDYVSFTKAQIQEKEKELKRDYRLMKDATKQSGVHFDAKAWRITASPTVWKNIIVSHPKAKKFRNKSFPLFEALGELHDGQTAEGTYNYTSNQVIGPTQVENRYTVENLEAATNSDLQETRVGQEDDEIMEVEPPQMPLRREVEPPRLPLRRDARSSPERETKRHKKTTNIEGLMEKYIGFRAKQAEEEATQLAEEKEKSEANDFSIKKSVSVVSTMEMTKEEKAASYKIFRDPDNRQIFLSSYEEDPEVAFIWLKSEMA